MTRFIVHNKGVSRLSLNFGILFRENPEIRRSIVQEQTSFNPSSKTIISVTIENPRGTQKVQE